MAVSVPLLSRLMSVGERVMSAPRSCAAAHTLTTERLRQSRDHTNGRTQCFAIRLRCHGLEHTVHARTHALGQSLEVLVRVGVGLTRLLRRYVGRRARALRLVEQRAVYSASAIVLTQDS